MFVFLNFEEFYLHHWIIIVLFIAAWKQSVLYKTLYKHEEESSVYFYWLLVLYIIMKHWTNPLQQPRSTQAA